MKTTEIHSMTGYGSAVFAVAGEPFALELRAVNSRHLDVRVRLPWHDARLESILTAAAKKGLHRGRLDVVVRAGVVAVAGEGDRDRGRDRLADTLVSTSADDLRHEGFAATAAGQEGLADRFRAAHAELSRLVAELGLSPELQAHDVIAYLSAGEQLARSQPADAPPGFDTAALAALQGALAGLQTMRRREGKLMAMAIGEQMTEAASRVTEIDRIAADQPRRLAERLRDRVAQTLEALAASLDAVDQSRLTGEIALLVDRADVTEELVRLRAHFAHFAEIMAGARPHGRKLDFLLQEMHREINTTGAKSSDSRTGNLVVDVKSIFEKIREVVQNVE